MRPERGTQTAAGLPAADTVEDSLKAANGSLNMPRLYGQTDWIHQNPANRIPDRKNPAINMAKATADRESGDTTTPPQKEQITSIR